MQKKHKPYPKSKELSKLNYLKLVALSHCGIQFFDENTVWTLITGQMVPIKNLRDSHLLNIVEMFNKRPGWRLLQQPYIYDEIERRKKLKLSKKSVAGKLLYGVK